MDRWRFLVCGLVLCGLLTRPAAAESAQCESDIDAYRLGLQNSEPWALQMYDSSTKLPSGLLDGNVLQMGNYDECLATRGPGGPGGHGGRFCRVRILELTTRADADEQLPTEWPLEGPGARSQLLRLMHLPLLHQLAKHKQGGGDVRNMSLEWGVCGPSTCGTEGIETVAKLTLGSFLAGVDVKVEAVGASCFALEDGADKLDAPAWGFVGLTGALLAMVVASSLYDLYLCHKKDSKEGVKEIPLLLSFSLQRNLAGLFNVKDSPGSIACLHGMRVLSLAWVIFGHRVHVQTDMANINALQILKLSYSTLNMIVLNAYLSVETFFLLSGLLVSYTNYSRFFRGHGFNIFKYYINRYVRLTVPLAVLIFFIATLSDKLVRGPLMDMYIDVDAELCRRNWWATLLYVNNYVNNLEVCGGQTWYLSVDMQLALVAPILLYPLFKWPKPTVAIICFLALASSVAVAAVTYVYDLFWTNPAKPDDPTGDLNFWRLVYSNTPLRAAPFLVGMALGWVLNRPGIRQGTKLAPWQVVLGWALSTAVCLTVVFVLAVAYKEDYQYDPLESAFYAGLHRLGWALGLSWVIFACATGYGGWVNSILSWKYWLPFSRLSYCYYLTHYVVLFWHGGTWRNPHHFGVFECVHAFFGDLFVVFAPSLLLHLAAEAPTSALLRHLLKKN